MKKIYYVTALVAGMLSLASCNDNEPGGGGNTPTNPQEGINFNIGLESATSRTKYAPNDWLQIEWVKDDKITICCDQTQAPKDADKTKPGYLDDSNWEKKTSAVYKVTKVIAENHTVPVSGGEATITNNSKAMIAVNGEETPLYWGKNNPDGSQLEHTFYAGYGENIKIDPSSGVATCMYDPEQILEYEDSTDTWINMKQAYMVAYTEPMTPRDDVSLKFKPIMTTLEIDVQGPQGSGDVTITAIEITIPKDQDKISTITGSSTTTPYAYFEYDIKGKTCPTVSSPKEEKMVFTLKTPKKVSAGGIVKITAILPPIIINSDNQLTITVDATNGINTAKFATGVATSAKAVIKTADWEITSKLPELVDLGLPSGTRWAKWNLGASKPEEYGDHFGWGCTVPYASSAYVGEDKGDLSLYFRKIGGSGTAMSHCGSDKDPLKNIANIACTEYDAAHVRLGGGDWHMPTQAEVYELIVNCNWAWTDNYEGKGAKGYIVTSKINNSSIFLPLAGRRESVNHNNPNSGGYYWNSTPSSVNNYDACRIYLNSSEHKWSSYRRYNGHSIRPVCGTIKTEEAEDLGLPSGLKWATCNLGASTPAEHGDYYGWGCTIPYTDGEYVDWPLYFQKLGSSGTTQDDCGTDKDPLKGFVAPNNKSIAGSDYDVAHVRLGDKWRMPTSEECDELLNNCNWQWSEYGGVNGYLVTSKSNGKSIFLPVGGWLSRDKHNEDFNNYWMATPHHDNSGGLPNKAMYFRFSASLEKNASNQQRCWGFMVRPVTTATK